MATSLVRCGGQLVKSVFSINMVQKQIAAVCVTSHQLAARRNIICDVRPQNNHAGQLARYSTVTQEEQEELDALYKGLDLELKGHDPQVLQSYTKFVQQAAEELDVNIYNVETPPKMIKRTSLLKSVHVYKKHFVQYESRTHHKVIQIKNITGSTADTFLEYIQRNLPEGVAMKVTKCRLEKIPEHIKPPTS